MLKNIKNKKGMEILQVIIIMAILGAATIAIVTALSGQLRNSTKTTIGVLQDGTANIYGNSVN